MISRTETLPYLITLTRTRKWPEVEGILTANNITPHDINWALSQGSHDCVETRRLAAYMLMTSGTMLEHTQLNHVQSWMFDEGGRSIRAMLAVALYKRNFHTARVLELFSSALEDPAVGEAARQYHAAA